MVPYGTVRLDQLFHTGPTVPRRSGAQALTMHTESWIKNMFARLIGANYVSLSNECHEDRLHAGGRTLRQDILSKIGQRLLTVSKHKFLWEKKLKSITVYAQSPIVIIRNAKLDPDDQLNG